MAPIAFAVPVSAVTTYASTAQVTKTVYLSPSTTTGSVAASGSLTLTGGPDDFEGIMPGQMLSLTLSVPVVGNEAAQAKE